MCNTYWKKIEKCIEKNCQYCILFFNRNESLEKWSIWVFKEFVACLQKVNRIFNWIHGDLLKERENYIVNLKCS